MTGRRHIVASMVALLSLAAPLCATADDAIKSDSDKWTYAKGLFRKQLDQPKEALNIGLHYWVELTRKGNSQRVSNKYAFKTGDQIQFHIRPNIDGYAYVVMRSGSRGESSVLFPDPAHGDDNRVEHGIDYALPSSSESFEFDQNPGTEKITLLLSRHPINAQAYLAKPADSPTVIASAVTGSKDLVPSQVFVAYATPHETAPPPTTTRTTEKKKVEKKQSLIASTPVTPDDSSESKAAKKHKTGSSHTSTSTSGSTTSTTSSSTTKQTTRTASNPNDDSGMTTVIKKTPDGVLFVNIDLDHRS
ncbi:MAG TPA: DUF4384 domain-containing protein [Drouetiella sp.]|jgi:Domain of unknown function (DUF4384)